MPDTLVITGTHPCGFCKDGRHERCCRAIDNGVTKTTPVRARVWLCPCEETGCGGKILSCVRCKKVHDDVNPDNRVCIDLDACTARMETRRANNPLYQQVREIQEKHIMAKAENTKTREPAKPKEGTCQCSCEGKTKGGTFLPGHDARMVSRLVGEVLDKQTTEAKARAALKPFSDALKAKFEKSLGIAQEKEQKRAEAEKAKADAKKAADAAKAEKAKAKAAAKS